MCTYTSIVTPDLDRLKSIDAFSWNQLGHSKIVFDIIIVPVPYDGEKGILTRV